MIEQANGTCRMPVPPLLLISDPTSLFSLSLEAQRHSDVEC